MCCFRGVLASVLMLLLSQHSVSADVLTLSDGAILNGKIIQWTPDGVVFSNNHGTFRIKQSLIRDVHVTSSFSEDIELLEQMGLSVTESDVQINYRAGLKSKEEMSRERVERMEMGGMGFSFTLSYLYAGGKLKEELPRGAGGHVMFDPGNFLYSGESVFLPELRGEFSYFRFEQDPSSVSGFCIAAGPMWLFPLGSRFGKFRLAILPGVSFLTISGDDFTARSNTFTVSSLLGYEYPLGGMLLIVNGRYSYFYDEEVPLTGMGIELGMGFTMR